MQRIKNDPKVALKLFLYFFKIGWFTFGGGFSILAQMQKDFVEKQHMVDEQTMLDQASIGRSLPGLMVANVAYLFGSKGVKVYTVIALVFIFLGTCMSSDLVWELTDFANYLMVLPNVIGLFGCTALVVALSKERK